VQDLSTCEAAGKDLATQVKRKQRVKERGSMSSMVATASSAQLALGRLVGSLAVVTAKDEEFTTGMLASWISQVRARAWRAAHARRRTLRACAAAHAAERALAEAALHTPTPPRQTPLLLPAPACARPPGGGGGGGGAGWGWGGGAGSGSG
jgi:hypothetical protein